MDDSIKRVLDKIEKIPTLPTTITNILLVLNNPNSSAEDVNKAISSDVSLSTKVLKLVNSSYYGLSKKVTSITQAIVILGFNTIKSLAFSASVMDLFSRSENPKFKRVDFWDHCFAVALIAKLISRHVQISVKEQESYFLAGLLHDIGKVVMDQYLHEDFDSVLEIREIENIPIIEAERRILGITHAEIGRKVAERWKFPEVMVESIRFHHDPNLSTNMPQLSAIVYLSDFLCKAKRIGNSGDYYINNFQEQYVVKYRITPDLIKTLIVSEIDKELSKAKSLFQIIKST
ncbi:MAG TPA: HDOD domain-containing protein [bacterium]|nr:HDOD domain-containing protein [bacterium]